MSNLFAKLEQEAFKAGITPRTRESREWFANKVRNMRNINRNTLMKDESLELRNQQLVGSMNMFFYDPKTKDTLPFFDRFPLAIVVGPAEGGFYGLNLHYLPMNLRAKFLDALLDNMTNKRYDEKTRFKLNYSMLQKTSRLKYFKPCFKHYLTEHLRSRFARVPSTEWEIATFLPTASWEKSSASGVYKVSRSMI
jgi:hypothetical protein